MTRRLRSGAPIRLAIVSSPRAGNMWLRRQLVALFGLEERSAHTPDSVDWEALPAGCVLQLHWPRTRAFARTLDRHGFRVLTLARHPLDILVSILQFSAREPATACWLDGAGGDERAIIGADPLSPAFRTYATGPRARALLDISPQWWDRSLFALRYEDLVAGPERELARIVDAVGVAPVLAPGRVADVVTFDALQREAANGHFWQGRVCHWRELLPADVAADLARPHQKLLGTLHYTVDADRTLSPETARARWDERTAQTGFAVWLTGLPSAGKSTLATLLGQALRQRGLAVEILDGDQFRASGPPLGFTRDDRERNVERLAQAASELVQAGTAVLIAAIAPFESSRRRARAAIEAHGRFAEVHVDAPIEICIARDPKGLYRKALSGTLARFTGISDPYEPPANPDIRIDTARLDPPSALTQILSGLAALGLLPG